MKTKRNNFQGQHIGGISLILAFVFLATLSCTLQEADKMVYEAYALRIDGHADSAKRQLEQITAQYPNSALAWYELSRATSHVGMANPQSIGESVNEAHEYISRATQADPENARYLSFKGRIECLQFYMALHTGDENAGSYLSKLEETYQSVFKLSPGYYENKITLVEFYGMLPPDMGGDPEKAKKYTEELEKEDLLAGAKAREILMPEDADYEMYWKEIVAKIPDNADAHQALGRIYLFNGDFDKAVETYQKAIDLDPDKNVLYLDLGRYQMMQAMQNPAVLDSVAPLITAQFDKFINATPEPINPMKAWTYSKLAMINNRMGNAEKSEELMQKANELDPFHSPAFGKPGMEMYCPPDQELHEQHYYMSPF